MNLDKYIRRLQEHEEVSQSIMFIVGDMVAQGVPECGRRIELHSDVYHIDAVSLGRLISGLRSKADTLEMELKHMQSAEMMDKGKDKE